MQCIHISYIVQEKVRTGSDEHERAKFLLGLAEPPIASRVGKTLYLGIKNYRATKK